MKNKITTYDKNNNPIYTDKVINQDKKWRENTSKEFYKKYGHWYYFSGVPVLTKKGWIEQFRKEYR